MKIFVGSLIGLAFLAVVLGFAPAHIGSPPCSAEKAVELARKEIEKKWNEELIVLELKYVFPGYESSDSAWLDEVKEEQKPGWYLAFGNHPSLSTEYFYFVDKNKKVSYLGSLNR